MLGTSERDATALPKRGGTPLPMDRRTAATHKEGRAGATLFYAALFAIAALGILAKPFSPPDYWTHLAVIRTLADGKAIRDIPIAQSPAALQRLHDPYHVLWASVMRSTGLQGTDVLVLAGLVNLAILLAGILFLARSLSRDWRMAIVLPGVLLLLWGTGYGWSSEYYLSILPVAASYPSTLAWGLSLIVLGLVHTTRHGIPLPWSRRGGTWRLGLAAALTAVVITVHALTAVMFTLAFPVLWVWLARVSWRTRVLVCLYPLAAVVLSLLWPYNSLLAQLGGVASHGINFGGSRQTNTFLSPDNMPLALGPIWAGAILLLWVRREWRRPLAAAAAAYAVLWLALTILGIKLGHRLIFFLAFVLQLAMAAALARGWRLWSRRGRARFGAAAPMAAAVVALLCIPWAPLHLWRVAFMCKQRVSIRSGKLLPSLSERYEQSCRVLRSSLPATARVVADARSHQVLAACGVPIVRGGGLQEREETLVTPDFIATVRQDAEKAGATHLLLDHILMDRVELKPWEQKGLESLGKVTRPTPDFTLVEFRPGGG